MGGDLKILSRTKWVPRECIQEGTRNEGDGGRIVHRVYYRRTHYYSVSVGVRDTGSDEVSFRLWRETTTEYPWRNVPDTDCVHSTTVEGTSGVEQGQSRNHDTFK